MHDSRKAVPLPRSGRLRPVARMVSGPDVLARRQRWHQLHVRGDRERFGFDGPAARTNWKHFATALICVVVMLAIAGAR